MKEKRLKISEDGLFIQGKKVETVAAYSAECGVISAND